MRCLNCPRPTEPLRSLGVVECHTGDSRKWQCPDCRAIFYEPVEPGPLFQPQGRRLADQHRQIVSAATAAFKPAPLAELLATRAPSVPSVP